MFSGGFYYLQTINYWIVVEACFHLCVFSEEK